jgi:hypothetical protein
MYFLQNPFIVLYDFNRMSAATRIKNRKLSDQRIQMQQLLPVKFSSKHYTINLIY